MEREQRSESPIAASVQRLREELDRWMDTAVTQGGKALNALGLKGERKWRPAIDVVESPDNVVVYFNLPGVEPSSVDVTIAGNMLTVKGESAPLELSDNDVCHTRQRNHGAFERSIPMPVPVDPDHVSAEAKQGVLMVQLAKAERAKSRQVPVRSEGTAGTPVG